MQWYDYIVLILGLLLICIIMMQESKDSIQDAFSGEKADLFKNQKQRGFEKVLAIATAVIAILFIVVTVLATVLR